MEADHWGLRGYHQVTRQKASAQVRADCCQIRKPSPPSGWVAGQAEIGIGCRKMWLALAGLADSCARPPIEVWLGKLKV
jgi:hypothetical protein